MENPTGTGRRYWLSYDLGLRGNYEELYRWLDDMDAEECGESAATFRSVKTNAQIKDELNAILGSGARIYLIGRLGKKRSHMVGKFIIGKRKKKSLWYGYAEVEEDYEDILE